MLGAFSVATARPNGAFAIKAFLHGMNVVGARLLKMPVMPLA